MDLADSVARQHQAAESGKERKVREGGDIVIREVDSILVL